MTIIGNTLAFVFVLSVLVVLHEFGHFAVAKAFGFPVEVFSVGFGKRLFGKKWRGTDYRVSAIPLGGYVRIVGLGPDESTIAEGDLDARLRPSGSAGSAPSILLAGPVDERPPRPGLLRRGRSPSGSGCRRTSSRRRSSRSSRRGRPAREGGIPAGRPHRLASTGKETPRWRDVEFVLRR